VGPVALNIAALARRTGVRPDTLRKWEHRYGAIRPQRTPGGQRRYTETDVARVEWLKARLEEGYRIGEAAALLGSTDVAGAPQSADELGEALYRCVASNEAAGIEQALAQAFGMLSVEDALTRVIAPVLERIGTGWAEGELSVAQEHLASTVVRGHLERLLADTRGALRGVAVLACAPGERHELGLLMLAIMLRADGWQVAYLGADTPLFDAAHLAQQLDARLLCVSATMTDKLAGLAEAVANAALGDSTELVLGGRALSDGVAAQLGGRYAGGGLRDAILALRT
jgi:methanogenic corrinoid protein MtbC1